MSTKFIKSYSRHIIFLFFVVFVIRRKKRRNASSQFFDQNVLINCILPTFSARISSAKIKWIRLVGMIFWVGKEINLSAMHCYLTNFSWTKKKNWSKFLLPPFPHSLILKLNFIQFRKLYYNWTVILTLNGGSPTILHVRVNKLKTWWNY